MPEACLSSRCPQAAGKPVATIAQFGVMQPIHVMPHAEDEQRYEIVFGHRRHEAAQEAGLADIPAMVVPRQDRLTYLKMALDENTKRQNMTERERAEAEAALKREMELAGLVAKRGGDRTEEQTATVAVCSYAETRAATTQESPRTISNYVAVGEATAAVKDALEDGKDGKGSTLTFAAAADLAGETPEVQEAVVARLKAQGVTKANAGSSSLPLPFAKSSAETLCIFLIPPH